MGTKELKAGIRRVLAVKSLGWEEIDFRYVEHDIEASENLFREELTPEEKVKSVARLAGEVKRMARERQITSTGGSDPQLLSNLPQVEKTGQKSRDIIADSIGWGGKTYEKAKKVVESGNREAIDKMNERSVDAGYRVLKPAKKENRYNTLGLSVKTFDFLEYLSYRKQESINKIMERAILNYLKDWYKDYNSEDDETRLRLTPYRSHLFQQKPSFDSSGGVIDYGRKD